MFLYITATVVGLLAFVAMACITATPSRRKRESWPAQDVPIPLVPVDEFEAIVARSYPQARVEQAFRAGPFGGAK